MKDKIKNKQITDFVKNNSTAVFTTAIILVLVLVFVFTNGDHRKNEIIAPPPASELSEEIKTPLVFFETKEDLTTEIITDGLNDLGLLVTQKYYFTEVTTFEKSKALSVFGWSIDALAATSYFTVQYDGQIFAGIDFTEIAVEKNERTKSIIITLPKAEIISFDLDYDSFKYFDEKNNIFHKLTSEDYNNALIMTKENAEQKAIERGLLSDAEENAKLLVENFIKSIAGNDYQIKYR